MSLKIAKLISSKDGAIEDKSIVLADEEFEFLKSVIENTLRFWADAHNETEFFPWELFEEDSIPAEINDNAKQALNKLKFMDINTFDLEKI